MNPAPRLSLMLALLSTGCAVNPRPTFDQTNASVKSRTGLETTWMRSETDEALALARVREILKEPLSPMRAAQVALINSRGLQARLEELGIAQAHRTAAGLPGNPEVEGFLGWPSSSGTNKIDVSFGLNILDLFVLPARKNLADLELKQAKALAGDEILRVATRAQTESYELQALEANASITALALEIEEVLVEFAEARFRAGNLSALKYEEECARRDDLQAKKARLDLQVRQQREAINKTLSLWGDLTTWTMAPLSAELPPSDPAGAEFETVALEQRFDLAAARAAIELLGGTLKLHKNTRLLPAGVEVGVRTEKEGGVRLTGPTVKLQLPIFNLGQAESARLEALYFQAQRLLEDEAARARSEVREKRDQLFGSRALVEHHEEIVAPRKKRVVEMTRGHYNMMLKGADDLLRARRDEVEAEASLVDARKTYWIARAELALALGGAIPLSHGGEAR
jgi:cobalt-zinc-cadmium efflux system outer membrane protein